MKQATLHWPIASTLIVSLLGVPAGLAAETPPAATILEVSGPVSWKAPGAEGYSPARGGESLFSGAMVKTGARGKARLRWQNGGDFRLMPLSEIKVADPDAVETVSGKIWSQFTEKLLRPFFFRSPSATAVVRGTTLAFGVDAEGATEVVVTEGKVEVSGRDGRTIFLGGGQAVKATPDGRLGPVGPMGQEQPPFDAGAESASIRSAAPADRPTRSDARSWARLDDWTRRGLDWLDRHRASERMPELRQEMTARTRPAAGQPVQVETPRSSQDTGAGTTAPAEPTEQPGDAWPQVPAAEPTQEPVQRAGDAWPLTPTANAPTAPAAPAAERPGDPWPSRGNGAPECVNRPESGTGQHTDTPECGQDLPKNQPPANDKGKR